MQLLVLLPIPVSTINLLKPFFISVKHIFFKNWFSFSINYLNTGP